MAQATTGSEVEEGIRFHYDLPPEFFALFLDKATMSYTCAYFKDGSDTIDEAQLRKVRLVSRKLQIKPGDRVLDIGCGWGNMVFHLAEQGCIVTGLTLALEQARYIEDGAARRGISDRVSVVVAEAAQLPFADGSFDKVVTIGATEQIADIGLVFKEVSRILTDEGLCLQHSITAAFEPEAPSIEGDFMKKHIFPTGRLKTLGEYIRVFEEAGLETIDVHDMTDDYPLTLRSWLTNLEAAGEEAAVRVGVAPDRYRAQRLFLAGCIVAFTESHCFLYQQLVRKTTPGKYRSTLPAGRETLALDDGPSLPLPSPVYKHPVVALEVVGGTSLYVDGVGSPPIPGEPPKTPDCKIFVSAETFAKVSGGELAILDAFLDGLVDVEGDLVAAAQAASSLLKLAG